MSKDFENLSEIFSATNMFMMPDDIEHLNEWIANLTGPGERVLAMTVAGMVWNLAAKMHTREIILDKEDAAYDAASK